MKFDEATLFAFLLVFVRCSAMLLASPVFGSPSTPLQVRIFTCMSLSGALTTVIQPHLGPLPADIWKLTLTLAGEALCGLLIGSLMNLVLSAAQMAGAILDLQIGLSMSQTMNPLLGVPVSVLSQFKYMLAMVVFLSSNAHHFLIEAFLDSYQTAPALGAAQMPQIQHTVIALLCQMSLLAVKIATPVLAVSLVVDAAFGLIGKAVPQMQIMTVGTPAKMAIGLLAVSLTLPPLIGGVTEGCGATYSAIHNLFKQTHHG